MAAIDDDGDAPPSLQSISDQVCAASYLHASTPPVAFTAEIVSNVSGKEKGVRRGFLNSKRGLSAPSVQQMSSNGSQKNPDLTVVKQSVQAKVPSFMIIPPTVEEQQLNAAKEKLIEALRPTRESVERVQQNVTLAAGFDDPDVMAAVNDIARDPSAAARHMKNPKVQQFYSQMAKFADATLQSVELP